MKKKINFIVACLEHGGTQRVIMNLALWMMEHGRNVSITVLGKKDEKNDYQVDENYHVQYIDEKGQNKSIGKKIGKLRDVLKQEKPDVVIIMGVPACIYAIPATRGLKIPVIISERNDPAHFNGRNIVKKISHFLIRYGDEFVFQTEDAKQFFEKKIGNRGKIISNPLAVQFPQLERTGERDKIIVTAGRLTSQKNHKLLIGTFKRIKEKYPDYKLYIFGEGACRKELEEYIESLHLENHVILKGVTDRLWQNIYNAKMFVLTSDFEGMPNALMEAMALGLPCISTDCPCGGPKMLITQEENGLLIPVNDSQKLEEAILKLIEDTYLSEKISRNAENVKQEYSLEKIAEKWMELIDNVSVR